MSPIIKYLGKWWEPEYNCWDLVRTYYELEFGIVLPPHPISVSNAVRQAELQVSSELAGEFVWEETQDPRWGDVALFGKKGVRFHVGVMLDRSTVLHLPENTPSCAVPVSRLKTSFDSVTFYRHSNT